MARLVDRRNKTEVKCCPTCRRDGWVNVIRPCVLTEAEQQDMFGHVKKLVDDPNTENCWASLGSSIHEATKEAVELAGQLDRRIVFKFNDKLVYVTKHSNVDAVVRDWWIRMYNETPEESARNR